MKTNIKKLLLTALCAGSLALLAACVAEVGPGPDYYGPAYGGVIIYGHPAYGDHFWGGPRGHWR